jgi:hypothetical protein
MLSLAWPYAALGNRERRRARQAVLNRQTPLRAEQRKLQQLCGPVAATCRSVPKGRPVSKGSLDQLGSSINPPPDDSIPRAGKQTTHTVAQSHAEGPFHRFGSPKCRPRRGEHPEWL